MLRLHSRPGHAAAVLSGIAALAGAGATATPIELVNRTTIAATIRANGDSDGPIATAANQRYLLFRSAASNLVAGDSNNLTDTFLLDTQTQVIERVNLGSSQQQSDRGMLGGGGGVSQDGRYILFTSAAGNFAASDTHGASQVYRRDRVTGTTTLISADALGNAGSGASLAYALSADGRYSLFASQAPNLNGPAAPGGAYQLYRHDAQTGTLERVSAGSGGQPGRGSSHSGTLSADGRHVLFYSDADDLIPGDANGSAMDLFLRDMNTGAVQIVSRNLSGAPMTMPFVIAPWPQFGSCSPATLSADGRYAVFATNESGGPGGHARDVYRYDSISGTTLRVSSNTASVSLQAFNDCPTISADGNRVAFASLGAQPSSDLLVRDIGTDTLVRVDATALPAMFPGMAQFGALALNDDGGTLLFGSLYLAAGQGQSHVFRSIAAAAPTRLTQALPNVAAFADDHSGDGMIVNSVGVAERAPGLSADGRYVAFASLAGNLVAGDNNGVADVFVRDRLAGSTERISLRSGGSESTCASRHASISADGRFVAFSSCGDLVAAASGGRNEVYRYDRSSGTLELVSVNSAGLRASGPSTDPQLSADGGVVAFSSVATDLLAAPASGQQIYVRDMGAAATALISRTPAGQPGDAPSSRPYLSADGRQVAFTSRAANLVAGDANAREDAFVADRLSLQTERISVASNGSGTGGGGTAFGLSADGSKALFTSARGDIHPNAFGFYEHAFLRDRSAGTTEVITVPGDAKRRGKAPTISADGSVVAFISEASSGLGPYDDTEAERLYRCERATLQCRVVTPYLQPDSGSTTLPQLAADGGSISFYSSRGTLAEDGNGRFFDVFLATGLADRIFADGYEG